MQRRPRRIFLFAGAALAIIGVLRCFGVPPATPDVELLFDAFAGSTLIGAGIGLIALELRWFDVPDDPDRFSPAVFYSIGFALTVLIGAFIMRCGMHQIGGYDHSILIEFGWRLYQGQRPYIDFPCTVPVAFPLGAKFAFQWFGVSWHSIILITAIFAMTTFAWSLVLFARVFGRNLPSLLWAFAVEVFSLMLASFWWYSPITAVAAVIYMLSTMLWLLEPENRLAMTSYGASLLLIATMKANAAGVMILGFSIVLLFSPRHRWRAIGLSLAAFASFLILLALNHFSFLGLLEAYRYISPRGASLIPFLIENTPDQARLALLEICAFLLPSVAMICSGARKIRSIEPWFPAVAVAAPLLVWSLLGAEHKLLAAGAITVPVFLALISGASRLPPEAWVGVVALLGGIYGCLTNSELKLIDIPPVLAAALVLAVASTPAPQRLRSGWSRYFSLVCAILVCLGLAQGWTRARVRIVGPGKFFEYDDSRHTIATGFFQGLHCGDNFYNVLNDIDDLLHREPNAKVFFGLRLQWAYAAFNQPSPLQQPVVWDPLTMFNHADEELYFDRLLKSRFDTIILLKNDLSFPPEERPRLLQQYRIDQSHRFLTLLRLKS